MKGWYRFFGMILVMAISWVLMERMTIHPMDWEGFFPPMEQTSNARWLQEERQYLFAVLPEVDLAFAWLDAGIIDGYATLEAGQYVLGFQRSEQEALLEVIAPYTYSGTAGIGKALLEGFFNEVVFYGTYIAPVLLLVLWWMTSLKYLMTIALEVGIYGMVLLMVLQVVPMHLDPIALLAMIFLMIYAFTLFNYLHSGAIDASRLRFGVTLSLGTTALSSLFLYGSDFGVVRGFGGMMLLGLGVLYGYLLGRLYGVPPAHLSFVWSWQRYVEHPVVKGMALAGMGVLVLVCVGRIASWHIDLNPLNLLGKGAAALQTIVSYEDTYGPSLPLVIQIKAHEGDFSTLATAQRLAAKIAVLAEALSVPPLSSLVSGYEQFAEASLKKANAASYAQYLLALEMMASPLPLLSEDMRQTYVSFAIPMTTPSHEIAGMVQRIKTVGEQGDFEVRIVGHVADFESYMALFMGEFLMGLGISLGVVVLFFFFYCRTWRSIAVIIPTLLALATLGGVHGVLGMELTLMSLLSGILFAGLVTDTMVHLFICYKHEGGDCFHRIFKPIAISNGSMLIGLGGMLFGGAMMQRFGLELGVLLLANTIFVLYLMPKLLQRYFDRCQVG